MSKNSITQLYEGDNGAHRYYEDAERDTIILKNHADPPDANWVCVLLNGKFSPTDIQRQAKAKPGHHYPLQAKTPAQLVRHIKRQYGFAFELA
jgi:hypothetical protein